jgi:threonine/homoserine efflux transporter RhtA
MEDVLLATLPTTGILAGWLVLHAQLILSTLLRIADVFALHLFPTLMLQETAFHAMLQDSGTPIPLPA